MRLVEIRLKNWCQYEGEHVLTFGQETDRNVVLIHADNDVGKTALFYSIAWCFHEHQAEKWKRENWPLYPIPWFEQAVDGVSLETMVAIMFEHDGSLFEINRSFKVTKKAGKDIISDSHSGLMKQSASGNWSNDSMDRIHRIFPKSVMGYFMFDAEEVEHFATESQRVRQSVLRLLDIEDGERAIDHLNKVASELRKEMKRNKSNRAEELEKQITALENELEQLDKDLGNPATGLRSRLTQLDLEKKAVQDQLDRYRDEYDLVKEEGETEKKLEVNKSNTIQLRQELKTNTKQLFVALGAGIVKWSREYLEDKRRKGELPKSVRRQFIDDRIKIGECVCGTPVQPGTTAHEKLLKFRDTLSDDLGDISQELSTSLAAIAERASSLRSSHNIVLAKMSELKKSKGDLERKLLDVRGQIQNRDLPDVPALMSKKQELDNNRDGILREIGRKEQEIKDKKTQKGELDKEYRAELKKDRRGDEAGDMYNLASDAIDVMTRALEKFRQDARTYLEQQVNAVGARLFWREGVYDIKISEDYALSVKTPTMGDRNALPGMSKGATEMAGLALIAALAKQTRAVAPLVMDTPFARLGTDHRLRALATCPDHFPQWILFLQPGEWDDSKYRPVVGHRIQKEYTLKRDNSTGITNCEDGYIPDHFGKFEGIEHVV